MNQDNGRCFKSLFREHFHPHKSIKEDMKINCCLKHGFIQYWIPLHRLPDRRFFNFSLRNVIWDHQVLTCFPVMTVIWRGVALSSTVFYRLKHTSAWSISWVFSTHSHVSGFPFRNWAIMNLTASSYWLNNYFGEAMDNVIQDSKGKNENLWESNKPNDLFCW